MFHVKHHVNLRGGAGRWCPAFSFVSRETFLSNYIWSGGGRVRLNFLENLFHVKHRRLFNKSNKFSTGAKLTNGRK